MRYIIFLIYVGGVMIMIGYFVMLMPSEKFGRLSGLTLMIVIVASLFHGGLRGTTPYVLIYRMSVVVMIGLLLFLVILSVVGIVDYSRGMVKMYVTIGVIFFPLFMLLSCSSDFEDVVIQGSGEFR